MNPPWGSTRSARANCARPSKTWLALEKTILLTTHYMAEAEELCQRIAIINKGKHRGPGQPGRAEAAHQR